MSKYKDDGPYYGTYIEAHRHLALTDKMVRGLFLQCERSGDGMIGRLIYINEDGYVNAVNLYSDEYVRELNVQEAVELKLRGVTAEAWANGLLAIMQF